MADSPPEFACRSCGYSLAGLPLEGACPECSFPIARSTRGDLLVDSPPSYLRKLQVGAILVVLAALMPFVLVFFACAGLIAGSWLFFAAAGLNLATLMVGSSRVDLQACKLEYSIVSPK